LVVGGTARGVSGAGACARHFSRAADLSASSISPVTPASRRAAGGGRAAEADRLRKGVILFDDDVLERVLVGEIREDYLDFASRWDKS
jgi:hypothetical protein